MDQNPLLEDLVTNLLLHPDTLSLLQLVADLGGHLLIADFLLLLELIEQLIDLLLFLLIFEVNHVCSQLLA